MMRNTIAVLSILIALGISGCSTTSLKGGYVGTVDISSTTDSRKVSDQAQNVFALVTEDGTTRTVDFSDTALITECTLKVDSLAEEPEFVPGQICEVSARGQTEVVRVDDIRFVPASGLGPGGVIIAVDGKSSGGSFVRISFKGLPSTEK